MALNVKVDLKGVERKFSEPNIQKGRYALANQVLADSDQFVPRKSGNLRMSVSVAMDAKSITYHQKYARRHYRNQFSNYTTPGTGPHWDKKASGIYGKQWSNAFVRGAGF